MAKKDEDIGQTQDIIAGKENLELDKLNAFEPLVVLEAFENVEIVIDKSHDCIYAYWQCDGRLDGHAWIFNIGEPEVSTSDEHNPGPNPFVNCRPHRITEPVAQEDFDVKVNPEIGSVAVYFRGKLAAILWQGCNPGKSAYADVDSMYATTMNVKPPIVNESLP